MKRFFSVFLCLILCFSIVVPASASSSNISFDRYLDVTAFCVNPSLIISAGSSVYCSFTELPQGQYYLADVIFYSSSSDIVCASPAGNLSKYDLGNGYFRCFGTNRYNFTTSVDLIFSSAAGASVEIVSCKVQPTSIVSTSLSFNFSLSSPSYYGNSNVTGSSSGTVGSSSDTAPVNSYLKSFNGYVYNSNWEKYDYLDFHFKLTGVNSLSSLCVKSNNGDYFPFDISVYDAANLDLLYTSTITNNTSNSTLYPAFSYIPSNGSIQISIRVDLTNCYRSNSQDDEPFVMFNGNRYYNSPVTIDLISCRGFVDTTSYSKLDLFLLSIRSSVTTGFNNVVNKLTEGFSSLGSKLDSIISGRTEDQTAADSFQDTVDEQASQFEDMSNTMNQVERPDIESIDLSTSNMVDTDSVILATNGIGTILENPIILKIIIMALTLALAGFVLYGKR